MRRNKSSIGFAAQHSMRVLLAALLLPAGAAWAESYTITTFAGPTDVSGDIDGPLSVARFTWPCAVAVDASGNVYVAEDNNTIRKITPAGDVTTLAGLAGSTGSTDGRGSAARFCAPWGLAVDGTGNIYVADYDNHTIRKITPAGDVTTLAGLAGTRSLSE